MTSSLVGSEMCIRDSLKRLQDLRCRHHKHDIVSMDQEVRQPLLHVDEKGNAQAVFTEPEGNRLEVYPWSRGR
eukprot:1296982-Prorocentrum_lima.AAC.1